MKAALIVLLAAATGFAAAWFTLIHRQAQKYEQLLAAQRAEWEAEKALLNAKLHEAEELAKRDANTSASAPAPAASVPARLTPAQIMDRLLALHRSAGGNSPRGLRETVYWLEELAHSGPAALPAIREFLGKFEEYELDLSWFQSRGGRDRLPPEFVVPPTLRFGLFAVIRQIGAAESETVLAEALSRTARGAEVAYLARALRETAGNKFRDHALSVAKALLADATPLNSTSPIDRYHRDYLFSVLSLYGDTSYAAEAQSQLVQPNNQIDRGALAYLQQSLGAASVPLVAQTYQHPALATNATAKEPLARLVLGFVGADPQANEFYSKFVNDPVLTRSHRKNLIEDLNQDGFPDLRNLGERDLPLIQNRISLIEQLAPNSMDEVNAAAFKEAYKDLVNMRDRIVRPQMITPARTTAARP